MKEYSYTSTPSLSPCGLLQGEILTYLTLTYLTLPYLTLPYLTLPYLTLLCLTLPYLTLPYLTLPYLTLPYSVKMEAYYAIMESTLFPFGYA
jgi:hypothetical protein